MPDIFLPDGKRTIQVSQRKADWLSFPETVEGINGLRGLQHEQQQRYQSLAACGDELLLRSLGVESLTLERVVNYLRLGQFRANSEIRISEVEQTETNEQHKQ